MENENTTNENTTIDHLLQIEAKAAALVNDAQASADKRIHESEEKNRASYEERFRVEAQRFESSLKKEIDNTRKEYQKALDEYRREISGMDVNAENFCAVLNGCLAKG